jgi:uncharacterized DUF497 family protein
MGSESIFNERIAGEDLRSFTLGLRNYKNRLTSLVSVVTYSVMDIEFDPVKNASNIAGHGVSMIRAVEMFQGVTVLRVDDRKHYGEARIIAYGHIDGRLHVCVYTDRGEIRRIISSRKANARERAQFDRQVKA